MAKWFPNALLFLLPAVWVHAVQDDPFFWDTVQLGSKHAHFFYQNQLRWALLPPEIDSGHPPLLGYYLAVLWTLLGPSLWVSHWGMYPFLVAILYFSVKTGQRIAPGWYWIPALWIIADPVMAGQSALMSPDVLLAAGMLAAINGAASGRRTWLAAGVLLLCAVSMRGMMCALALAVWVWWQLPARERRRGSVLIRTGWPFLPGGLLGAAFLWWHYQASGWVGHFEGSSWAGAFERVNGQGFVRNIAILGWRWTDMNRFAMWGFLFFWAGQRGLRAFFDQHKKWCMLLLLMALFLSPTALLYQNLSAHRYFLPVFIALHLLLASALAHSGWKSGRIGWSAAALALILWTGHYWIYPRGISMDWDSTLAHRAYHPLRAEAIAFLDREQIDFNRTGTTFPNLNTGEHLLLNRDMRKMAALDLEKNDWVMASNVFNDINEPEYEVLDRDWETIWYREKAGVWIRIYRRKALDH